MAPDGRAVLSSSASREARLRHDVPAGSRVVQVDGLGGGFEQRQAVVVVGGMEQLDVVDTADAHRPGRLRHDDIAADANGAGADGVVEGRGPAVGTISVRR